MEDGLAFLQDDRKDFHLVGLLLSVQFAFETVKSLVENRCFLTEYLIAVLRYNIIPGKERAIS